MKVAIVIPCHNVQDHVAGAVRSAMMDAHSDVDVLAVDDGSTDGTQAVLRAMSQVYSGRFRWITQVNKGACAARNAGVRATEGDYLQFLDADDVLEPGKVARQMAIGENHGMPDLVVGGYRNLFETGGDPEVVLPLTSDPWEALVRTRMGTTSANLFRRDALLSAGGWDEDLRSSQDYELMFRLLVNGGSVDWDPEVGCDILKRATGSISKTDERENWVRYLELRRSMRDHLKRTDSSAHAHTIAVADQYLFMAIRVLSKHDLQAAFEEFDRSLHTSFLPERSPATSAAYIAAYRSFGFRFAERAARFLGSLKNA